MSNNFQTVDFSNLAFPSEMLIDYVRVYQRSDGKMGCDPSDRPTADYIAAHANAYNNPNLTTWAQAGYSKPVSAVWGRVWVCVAADVIGGGRKTRWSINVEVGDWRETASGDLFGTGVMDCMQCDTRSWGWAL